MDEDPNAEDAAAGMMANLFDLAPCAMVISDRLGVMQKVNHAFARLVGWSSTTPPADRKFRDLLTRPSQYIFGSQVLPPLHLAGAVQEIELDILGEDGRSHAVLLSGVQLGAPEKDGLHYFSLTETKARRVYEREQLEARTALERKQEYLDLAEKLARVGHWYVDLASRESFWSPEVYVIHGLDPQTTAAPTLEHVVSLYHPDDRDAVRNIIAAAIADHRPFAFQKRLAATERRGERIVEAYGEAEFAPDGRAVGVFGVLRDVTASVGAQRDLETSEERYRLLADNVPGLISYWDSQQRCRFANRAYLDWFGRAPETLLGRAMADELGAQYANIAPYVLGVLAGQAQTFEGTVIRASGDVGHTLARYVPDFGPAGEIRGFHALVTDVTELKERNLAEQASNALKTAVLSSTHYMVIATTPQGIVTVFNAAAEAALGYTADEVIGKQTPALWHDRDEISTRTAQFNDQLPDAIEPGFATLIARPPSDPAVSREWCYVRKDGTRFPVRVSGTRLMDADGQVTGYLGVVEDITERHNAEEALRSSEATFQTALDYASIGMVILDPSGRWLRVNKAIAQLLGYSEKELLQTSLRALTHPDDLEESQRLVRRLLAGQIETGTIEKRYLRKDGSTVWAQLSAAVVRHADGSPQFVISQIQDISDRREVERVKNEFISTVSHELRTPVTSIRGALGLLAGPLSEGLPPEVTKLVSIANKNSERLLLLVNDMLDIDRMASGKMRFDVGLHGLDGLVAAAIEGNQPYADRFAVSIVAPREGTGLQIAVDAARFQQVMSNLLSNAAKFSPPGGRIDVFTSRRGGLCRVAVRDQGQGISAAFAPHVFGKFSQADSSASRRKSGSGLGLHISRGITEHMGGSMGFDSEPGQGATFWIDLPVH